MNPTRQSEIEEMAQRFWDTDLEELERITLKGKRITDLPIREKDERIPANGSVLLHKTVKVEEVAKTPSLLIALWRIVCRKF